MNLLLEAYEISLQEANYRKEGAKKSCKENDIIDEAEALFKEIFYLSEKLNCKVSSFIQSVYDYFLEHDKLSEKQLDCLTSNVESLRRRYKRKDQ